MVHRYRHQDVVKHNGLTPYMESFLEWSQVKGYSKDTQRRRQMALRRFIVWCDERDLNEPQAITKPILERYQRYLYYYRKTNGQPLSFGTQHVMLTSIKRFFKWLTQQNHLLYNPASELELPQKPRRLPRHVLHIDEVERILAQPDIDTCAGIRDRSILETLYSTGIRRMELVNVQIYDIDTKRSTLLVRAGKGQRDRYVPIGERALHWLEHYRLDVRSQLVTANDDGILYVNDEGQTFRRNALTGRVKRYLQQAGIDTPGSCHLFRHAMATHMLDNGADIRFIQAMLGHADLNTTQIYTHVSIEKLKQIHTATHPAKTVDDSQLLATLDTEAEDEIAVEMGADVRD